MTLPAITSVSFALACALFTGCGSTQTVDSRDVPLRPAPDAPSDGRDARGEGGATASPAGVPDIHQSYSATYSAADDRTVVLAQFRVRGPRGDTIRFGDPGQVRYVGAPLRLVDGDAVNAAVTVLNHLTFLPLFSLFRTGTFYSGAAPGLVDGRFAFLDDVGHLTETVVAPPRVSLGALPDGFVASPTAARLEVALALPAAVPGTRVRCVLSSERPDAEGRARREITPVDGTVTSGAGACAFTPAALAAHAGAREGATLEITVSTERVEVDAWGRAKEIRAHHVVRRSLVVR